MLAAQELCAQRGLDFGAVFAHQYVLSRSDHPTIEGWGGPMPMRGWQLSHCRRLDCRDIVDATGTRLGWLLGVAVDADGAVVSQRGLRLRTTPALRDFWESVTAQIEPLAGKYIAILLTDQGCRMYFDPVLDLPAVFNRDEGLVAGSPLLAIARAVRVNPRIDYNDILADGGNYGLQNTCDAGVLRAISNHYLDLDHFDLHRHWPRAGMSFEDDFDTAEDAAHHIIRRLGQIARALITHHITAMPISGGNDSRTLVYAARDALGQLDHAYAHRINWITKFDCFLGKKLADELGVPLQLIDAVGALDKGKVSKLLTRRLTRQFRFATGYMQPPKRAELLAYNKIPETELVLRGNIMDMTRANIWPRGSEAVELEHMFHKLGIGGCPVKDRVSLWSSDYLAWQDSLPENARCRIYDFAFVEQLLPNTLGARLMGFGRANYVNPFNDRQLITTCMKLSPPLRKSGKFNTILHAAVGAPDMVRARKLGKQKQLHDQVDQLFG